MIFYRIIVAAIFAMTGSAAVFGEDSTPDSKSHAGVSVYASRKLASQRVYQYDPDTGEFKRDANFSEYDHPNHGPTTGGRVYRSESAVSAWMSQSMSQESALIFRLERTSRYPGAAVAARLNPDEQNELTEFSAEYYYARDVQSLLFTTTSGVRHARLNYIFGFTMTVSQTTAGQESNLGFTAVISREIYNSWSVDGGLQIDGGENKAVLSGLAGLNWRIALGS